MQSNKVKTIDFVIIIMIGVTWLAVDGWLILFTAGSTIFFKFAIVNLAFLVVLKLYLIISEMIGKTISSEFKGIVLLNGVEQHSDSGNMDLDSRVDSKRDVCGLEILIEHYRLEAQHRQIYFDAQLRSDPAKLKKDDFVLTTIAGNLLNNAFDAIESLGNADGPKRILFNCQECEEGIMISVYNDYPYELRRLLREEILFQEGYTTNVGENRGNGLHIVKQMVSARDGVIFMDKTEGVEFIVEL